MNYDGPRQRQSDSRWDFTSMNDGYIHPIGYCHAWNPPLADDWLYISGKSYWDTAATFKHKYHTDGHATDVEACDCYREYVLDQRLFFVTVGDYNLCEVCGALTNTMSQLEGWTRHRLCSMHANRDEVGKLWPGGEVFESTYS